MVARAPRRDRTGDVALFLIQALDFPWEWLIAIGPEGMWGDFPPYMWIGSLIVLGYAAFPFVPARRARRSHRNPMGRHRK